MKDLRRLVPVLVLVFLLVVSVVAAGCGDSEEAATTTAAPTETTQAGQPSGEAVVLRLPMGQPDGDPLVVPLQNMADRFNARTNGTYQIQLYTAASLIAPPEALDACRTGTVELASICYPIYAGVDERLCINELPFIFDNIDALSAAHNDDMVALYDGLMTEKFNQKVLGMNHIGFNELIATKPVKTLDDWKGMLTGLSSPIAVDMVQLLGGQTVVIDWMESYSNLEKKVVDGIIAGTTYMWIAELYKPAKYSTWMAALAGQYGLNVNLDVWNAMPPDIQQILAEEARLAHQESNQAHVDIYQPNMQTLIDNGCEVFIVDDAERDKWKAQCEAYVAEKVALFGDFGTEFMRIVEEANAANP